MAEFIKNELQFEHRFDQKTCRHTINGITAVLHCHHFATLTTQLANDCGLLDGKKLLADCAEDAFYQALDAYYKKQGITGLRERIEIGEQYFSAVGLGKLKVQNAGLCSGKVILEHSHVDEGWIQKWGKADKSVNHIGCGYVCALFSAVYGRPRREYRAVEEQSIVKGAAYTVITVTDVRDLAGGRAYEGQSWQ
ncbi:hypothetical protein AGMMS49546_18140 [Spirochaetia bacterium]|nr:hypothetical protein AGMMS49546_18140 [Spirochaetia bacterium]